MLGKALGPAEGECLFGGGPIELGLIDGVEGEVRAYEKVLFHGVYFILIVNFVLRNYLPNLTLLIIKSIK
jgi:hypothetical protein